MRRTMMENEPHGITVVRAPRMKPRRSGSAGAVRIIGGEWRGTRLPVADLDGLRPTSDRVRETLFNWLQPKIAGARVLDLFAGSGALGFEAASRGAGHATFVEQQRSAAAAIRAVLDEWHETADRKSVV